MIEKLLDELDMAWNDTEDPRWKGENPRCSEIDDILISLFRKTFLNLNSNKLNLPWNVLLIQKNV